MVRLITITDFALDRENIMGGWVRGNGVGNWIEGGTNRLYFKYFLLLHIV